MEWLLKGSVQYEDLTLTVFRYYELSYSDESQPHPGLRNLLHKARQELSHYGLDIYVFEMSLFRAGLSTDPAFKSQWSPSDDTVNGMEYTAFKVLKTNHEALQLPRQSIPSQLT